MAAVQQWDLSLLATLGGALGDATRFAMFEHVMTSSDPVSASETAAVFGLHRTVARSHLEKLAEAGLVTVGTRRNPRGGRPAKVYSPTTTRLDIQVPPRQYRSLSAMLVRLVSKLNGGTVALAEEVGRECGRQAAESLPGGQFLRDGRLNLGSIVAHLRETGCSPHATVRDDHTLVVETKQLPLPRDRPRAARRGLRAVLGPALRAHRSRSRGAPPDGRDRRRRHGLRARVRTAGLETPYPRLLRSTSPARPAGPRARALRSGRS